jgi:nucleotide-binding universal stress UspA family protein
MTQKKILVAVDSSEHAIRAVEAARDLSPDAAFILVSAWHVPTETEKLAAELADGTAFLDRLAESAQEAGESDVKEAAKHLVGKDVETALISGHPGKAICEEAKQRAVDLVVVGSRGRGGLGSLVLGSVSHYVLHHAGCPVMIVK